MVGWLFSWSALVTASCFFACSLRCQARLNLWSVVSFHHGAGDGTDGETAFVSIEYVFCCVVSPEGASIILSHVVLNSGDAGISIQFRQLGIFVRLCMLSL